MEILGRHVHLTEAEQRLSGLDSPLLAEEAFSKSPQLMAQSRALSEQIQAKLATQAETYDESRWRCARGVVRALRQGNWAVAASAVKPAVEQAISPDANVLRSEIDAMSDQAMAYGNLANALRHGEVMRSRTLAVSEADTAVVAGQLVDSVEDYLALQAHDEQ